MFSWRLAVILSVFACFDGFFRVILKEKCEQHTIQAAHILGVTAARPQARFYAAQNVPKLCKNFHHRICSAQRSGNLDPSDRALAPFQRRCSQTYRIGSRSTLWHCSAVASSRRPPLPPPRGETERGLYESVRCKFSGKRSYGDRGTQSD